MAKKASRSARYYQNNPGARARKKAYDTKFNEKPSQRKKRSELVTKNRDADKKGVNRTGKDYDHGSKRYISSSKNRGKKTGTAGDRSARGGKGKK